MTWKESENNFASWDGTRLFYREWETPVSADKGLIVIHRGHEHSGRVAQQVKELDLPEFKAFCFDVRGHGHSPGERGYAESYYAMVKDLDAFARHVSEKHGIPMENFAILANSVGAVTASTWVHDFAPRIRAMVLAAPALRIRLYVPLAIPGLRLLQKLKGKAFISSYVKSKMLTHDPEQCRLYDEDKLITRNIAVNILLGLHDTATRIMDDAGAITTPTLVLSAGSDWVVKNSAQDMFFNALSSPMKEHVLYPGFFHGVLYEKDRHLAFEKAREFIKNAFTTEVDRSKLLEADESGYTKEEYDRLQEPANGWKALKYGSQLMGMKSLGRLSEGIRLGLETGFDSGKSLDYVYENKARGITPLGRMIDRSYLNAIGWKGIRERGTLLKELLQDLIIEQLTQDTPVRILDIATGCGRYVLDVLKEFPGEDISALLRDNVPRNLEQGRALAQEMGLANVTYEEGDAFDEAALAAVSPKPTIVIVSGLYELFRVNNLVLRSLGGVAESLVDGGKLIYTGQPWHPDIEMIARTCINREGHPWIMRRRTQAEMDELVRSHGLVKTGMKIDSYGIFTVSVAQKRGNS
ncbi:MAG: bifunctional alpha/beta hydrolase/class I SAM-dependent methyltransferase [Puniceicoccaceae bacterium]